MYGVAERIFDYSNGEKSYLTACSRLFKTWQEAKKAAELLAMELCEIYNIKYSTTQPLYKWEVAENYDYIVYRQKDHRLVCGYKVISIG